MPKTGRRMIAGLLVRTDGTTERLEVEDDYRAIAKVIGSQYVEGVNVALTIRIYVDEEGRLLGAPLFNAVLTGLSGHPAGLYGDGFVLGGVDDDGYDLDLDPRTAASIESYALLGEKPVEDPANREPVVTILTGDAAMEAMFGKPSA